MGMKSARDGRVARALLRRGRARAIQLGVLQVYSVQPVPKPRGQQLKLLFPAGVPLMPEESAVQLAQAAEEKRPVLISVSSLRALITRNIASLPQIADQTHAPLLKDNVANSNSEVVELQDGTLAPQESIFNALISSHASPLGDILSADVTQPDWRKTVTPERTSTEPTEIQRQLLCAAIDGDIGALNEALANCSRSEVADASLPPSGGSALHLAAASGHLEAVEALLKAGCSVHAVALNGSTPLHWAAGSGEEEVVRVLLRAGADPRARSSTWRSTVRGDHSGQTPAHWAAASGHSTTLELLLQSDAQALLLEDERQLCISKVAASNGHIWLHNAMKKLKEEEVVCVRIERQMTLQKVVDVKPPSKEFDEDSSQR